MSQAPRGGVINRLETALYALYGVGAHSLKTLRQGKGAKMDNEDLSQRDVENIGKWERAFKALNRKTYTIQEAAAFMIDWHPAAYLNDYKKNQIAGLVQRINNEVFLTMDGNKTVCYLENECSVPFNGQPAFSKQAYYDFLINHSFNGDFANPEGLEWFQSLKKVKQSNGNVAVIDIDTTRFNRLVKGSNKWEEWRNKPCYTIEEMAYLILGLEPITEGRYIDEKTYLTLIYPLVNKIKEKVEREAEDDIPF